MKTTVRTITPHIGWNRTQEAPLQRAKRLGRRLCTSRKESILSSRVTAGTDELFDYAMRETARTVFWETLVVGILILCAWGLCLLVAAAAL